MLLSVESIDFKSNGQSNRDNNRLQVYMISGTENMTTEKSSYHFLHWKKDSFQNLA